MPTKIWDFEDIDSINQLVVDTDAATVVLCWAYKPGAAPQFEAPRGVFEWKTDEFLEQGSPHHSRHEAGLVKRLVSADVRRAAVAYIHRSVKPA